MAHVVAKERRASSGTLDYEPAVYKSGHRRRCAGVVSATDISSRVVYRADILRFAIVFWHCQFVSLTIVDGKNCEAH